MSTTFSISGDFEPFDVVIIAMVVITMTHV
jgi:hypothetical protein